MLEIPSYSYPCIEVQVVNRHNIPQDWRECMEIKGILKGEKVSIFVLF